MCILVAVETTEGNKMEILMNLWLAFNVVFGLWTAKNISVRVRAFVSRKGYTQSDLGKFLDLIVMVSILAYVFSV
jgi:hypothetical protein